MRARHVTTALITAALALGCEPPPPVPPPGSLRIAVATTGADLDPDGYNVDIEGASQRAIGDNGVAVVTDLVSGSHTVALSGLATNCAVSGQNPRAAVVRSSDTMPVDFAVGCVATGVRVSTTTTGLDLDSNGYAVAVDGGSAVVIGLNGSVDITHLSAAQHTVTLSDLAVNCAPSGQNPRIVTVATGQLEPVAFNVTCAAKNGVVDVMAATTGIDLDPNGYQVQLDSGTPQPLPINGRVRYAGVPGGTHTVTLSGATSNCAVGENPRTLTVTTGGTTRDTVRTTYQVTCVAFAGIIEVTTATTGVNIDANGYQMRVDGGSAVAVGVNSVARVGVEGGAHLVALQDVAPNCAVAGDNPRTVSVTTGGATRDTARTTFAVTCEANFGFARVITATTGTDIDPDGYWMAVDCYDYYGYGCYYATYGEQMAANDTALVSLTGGDHTVQISDVAPNCTIGGAQQQTVHIGGGNTIDVMFSVTCAALTRLDITTTTTGVDLDLDGYLVSATSPSGGVNGGVPINGGVTLTTIHGGDYTVALSGVAFNCTVTSPSSVTVSVPDGGTASVSFTVECATAAQLAFSNGSIYLMKTNGAGMAQLTTDVTYTYAPAWSPDATRIAFTATRDGNAEIYVMSASGANQTRLTNNAAEDSRPAWSPVAAKIAFVSARDGNAEIYVMNDDGSNPVNLTANVAGDVDPAWSPDGTKIAFGSTRGGIHVMNPDGSGLIQLTHDASDSRPTWSPDGTRLAFSRVASCGSYYGYFCERDLYVVNSDGTGLTPLVTGSQDQGDPAWSPDGAWIAFNAAYCDDYYGCGYSSLWAVRSNGTDQRQLSPIYAFHPAWKP